MGELVSKLSYYQDSLRAVSLDSSKAKEIGKSIGEELQNQLTEKSSALMTLQIKFEDSESLRVRACKELEEGKERTWERGFQAA